ncbi:MAG: S8/S53 family peptidase [Armatimonadetes bacterium]|nr:S8/S53 family peptidase [Armatimonadota bacterium]
MFDSRFSLAARRRPLSRLLAVLLTTLGGLSPLGAPAARAAEPMVAVASAVPPASLLRQARLLGRQAQNTPVDVILTLPLRNQEALSDLLHRLYDPEDPLYGKYLSSDEFTQRFGPTQADYDAVAAFARAHGLSVRLHSGRTMVAVSGASGTVERAFGVRLNQYWLPEGRVAYANDAAPSLPASVAARVGGVVGLDNLIVPHRYMHLIPQAALDALRPLIADNSVGSDSSGGLTPQDIRNIYNLNLTAINNVAGEGQSVALLEPGNGYYLGDVGAYVSKYNLGTNAGVITTIPVAGYDGSLGSLDGQREAVLDIDMVLALAPRIKRIFTYVSPQLDGPNILETLTQAADDRFAQTLSISLGGSEAAFLSEGFNSYQPFFNGVEAQYERLAAEGVSVFVASGDQGAYTGGSSTPAVNDLAAPPTVTGVGGTTLSFTGTPPVLSYPGETPWGDSTETPPAKPGAGGGGGYSIFFRKPSYQYTNPQDLNTGVGYSEQLYKAGKLATPMRDVPDVALNADPNTGYAIYVAAHGDTYPNGFEVIGGTSAASPLWAAFTALVNESRALSGGSPTAGVDPGTPTTPIGFANPLIYAIGLGRYGSYANDFHDVTQGNNLLYLAATGYDDATGFGSFNGANLLHDMAAAVYGGQGSGTGGGTSTATSHEFQPGLQMISAPFDFSGTGLDYAGLFGLSTPLPSGAPRLIEYYNGAYVYYPKAPADTLRPGFGYWLNVPAGGLSLNLQQGSAVASPLTIALQSGWNQIGDPFTTSEPLVDITVASDAAGTGSQPLPHSALVGSILYTYPAGATRYSTETSALQPYLGYWIFARQAAYLTYTSTAGAGVPAPPAGPPAFP